MSQDWKDYLAGKLGDRNPKCGNCNFWSRQTDTAIGTCTNPKNTTKHGDTVCMHNMSDLTVCSIWEQKQS